jgi:hypothetical protein
MGRDDQQGQAERLDEVIEFGGSRRSGSPKPPWPRWLPLVLAAGVAVAIVAYVEHARNASTSPPHPPTTARPWWLGRPAPSEAAAPAPRATEVGHPLLGVTSGWELFGRGPSGVVRIELAHGRLTATAVPALASTGPVSFIVGQDWAMIRPLDFVPGYVVPDGQPAHALTGALSRGGPALPGPDRATVWASAGDADHPRMTLVDTNGRPTEVSVAIPEGMGGEVEPDGTGYLLLTGPGGVFAARPDGVHQVSTGALLAVGPTRWLTLECDDQHRCATIVVDRHTGARRVLAGYAGQANRQPGVISPNGATAALLETDSSGVSVHLLDLVSGTDRRLGLTIDQPFEDDTMVWSPDSRWLFIAAAEGRLCPVDPATAQVHDLGVALPPIKQLSIRSTRQ